MLWKQHHPYANCNFCVRCISFLLLYTSCLKRAPPLSSLWWRECVWPTAFSLLFFFFFLQTTPRVSLRFRSSIILVNYSFPLIFEPKNRNCSVRKRISWLRSVSYLLGKAKKGKDCMSRNNVVKNTKYRRWIEKNFTRRNNLD